jgi:hypothetical protein
MPLPLIAPEPRHAIAARGLGLLSEQRVDLVRAQPDLRNSVEMAERELDGNLAAPPHSLSAQIFRAISTGALLLR